MVLLLDFGIGCGSIAGKTSGTSVPKSCKLNHCIGINFVNPEISNLLPIISVFFFLFSDFDHLTLQPMQGVLSATVLSLIPMIRPFQWQSLMLPVS